MQMTFRPLDKWKWPKTEHRRDRPYKATYQSTLIRLDSELRKLDADVIVLQTFHKAAHVRIDGQLRSNAPEPIEPGVVLSFNSRVGPLSYPCDSCTKWKDNIRSIALGLEALRAVDRYGIAARAEQYKGWATLEDFSLPETAHDSFAVLSNITSDPVVALMENETLSMSQLRTALFKYHPDRKGDVRIFKQLGAAKRHIEDYFSSV